MRLSYLWGNEMFWKSSSDQLCDFSSKLSKKNAVFFNQSNEMGNCVWNSYFQSGWLIFCYIQLIFRYIFETDDFLMNEKQPIVWTIEK